jgi:two-component system, response regulator PdtaR
MVALNVLIIEDDALIGMLLTEMLQEMGHVVCATAVTEEDAVADAARYKPSLMIVDEQLLEGSGMSAVERILRTGSVACVFMSGANVRRPGATVLLKPFVEADLVRAIQNVVGSANLPAVPKSSPRTCRAGPPIDIIRPLVNI